MRILVVHNCYRSELPSGENSVVADEVAWLREAGVEVATYFRNSDEILNFSLPRRIMLGIRPTVSLGDVHYIRRLLDSFRPDAVHLHNPYPLISPWVVRTAKAASVPVVQTVHNFRLACAPGTYFRSGQICTDCSGKRLPTPAIVHGCYRGSRAQSAVLAAAMATHRRTWQMVDRFIPLSPFAAEHLVREGISADRITVKPNSARDPGPPAPLGHGFLFAGRLSVEKGVGLLIAAWQDSGMTSTSRLVIAGDGPLRREVELLAARDPSVTYVGLQTPTQMRRLLSETAVVVVPSVAFEVSPIGVIEAFAAGRPVVVTNLGALPDLVDSTIGWIASTHPQGLAACLRAAESDEAEQKGRLARMRYEQHFTPSLAVTKLLSVYESVRSTTDQAP